MVYDSSLDGVVMSYTKVVKTTCFHGHPIEESRHLSSGKMRCNTCNTERVHTWRDKKRGYAMPEKPRSEAREWESKLIKAGLSEYAGSPPWLVYGHNYGLILDSAYAENNDWRQVQRAFERMAGVTDSSVQAVTNALRE